MPATSTAQRRLFSPETPHIEYIAGFFDGEGCVTIRRSNHYTRRVPAYRMVVSFTNKCLPVLTWIQSLYGGRLYPKARRSKKHSPAWELVFTKQNEGAFLLAAMLPHLHVKRAQADLGLAFVGLGNMRKEVVALVPNSRGGKSPVRRAIAQEVALRESYKQKLTAINARGPLCLQ